MYSSSLERSSINASDRCEPVGRFFVGRSFNGRVVLSVTEGHEKCCGSSSQSVRVGSVTRPTRGKTSARPLALVGHAATGRGDSRSQRATWRSKRAVRPHPDVSLSYSEEVGSMKDLHH